MDGLSLLRLLIEATGLPPESMERELRRVIEENGLDVKTLTLDQVREVMATYLQDVLVEAKDNLRVV